MSIFTNNKRTKVKRNMFNLSQERKLSLNMGKLYPIMLEEIIPNDRMSCNTESLIRFHPLIAPIMHRIDAFVHYFYVPYRLIYEDWDNFIKGGDDGKQLPPYPTIAMGDSEKYMFGPRTLSDYFGLPAIDQTQTLINTQQVSCLPFRAYSLIWNEFFRDENLQTKIPVTKTSVCTIQEANEITQIRRRAWAKDYFTSSLPWTQKGGEVLIPMTADVNYKNVSEVWDASTNAQQAIGGVIGTATGLPGLVAGKSQIDGGGNSARIENIDSIENANTTINDLRKSIHLQKWLERNARAGNRLSEFILEHFGVISDDLRIDRPQYLGGGKSNVTISEVLANFGNAEIPQGNMSGHAFGVGNSNSFKHTFKEHGYVIGLMSVLPKPSYQQGIRKMWQKFDKFDYAFPEFANLGEQPVANKELYYDPTDTNINNDNVFGYQSRYAEYKHGVSTVHGDFRDTLSFWHGGRIFANRPNLNESFITCDTTEIDDRIFPVDDSGATDKLYVQLYNNIKVLRCLPVYGTPTL